jgi:hypothetical protein
MVECPLWAQSRHSVLWRLNFCNRVGSTNVVSPSHPVIAALRPPEQAGAGFLSSVFFSFFFETIPSSPSLHFAAVALAMLDILNGAIGTLKHFAQQGLCAGRSINCLCCAAPARPTWSGTLLTLPKSKQE